MPHAGKHKLTVHVSRCADAHRAPGVFNVRDRIVRRYERIGPAVVTDKFSAVLSKRAEVRTIGVDDRTNRPEPVRIGVEIEVREAEGYSGLIVRSEVLEETAPIIFDAYGRVRARIHGSGWYRELVADADFGAERLTVGNAAVFVCRAVEDRFVRGYLCRRERRPVCLRVKLTAARIDDDAGPKARGVLTTLRE